MSHIPVALTSHLGADVSLVRDRANRPDAWLQQQKLGAWETFHYKNISVQPVEVPGGGTGMEWLSDHLKKRDSQCVSTDFLSAPSLLAQCSAMPGRASYAEQFGEDPVRSGTWSQFDQPFYHVNQEQHQNQVVGFRSPFSRYTRIGENMVPPEWTKLVSMDPTRDKDAFTRTTKKRPAVFLTD